MRWSTRTRPLQVTAAAAALLVGMFGLTGCATGANTESPDQKSNTLTFGIYADITSLDKQSISGRPGRFILNNAYETLVSRDDKGQLIPHILKSWSYDTPTQTWTMTARDDIDFWNGDHLTAEDLKASFDRIADPATQASLGTWWDIKSTTVTGKYTVQVVTNKPNPLAMIRGDDTAILPKSWIDKVGDVPYTGTTPPPGMGAYELVQWKQDDEIVFKANPHYFLGKPKIENLIFKVIPDAAAREAALLAGDVDVIYPMSPDEEPTVAADPDLEVQKIASTTRARIVIDTRSAPWNDLRVREALNMAIDRATIVKNLLPGAVALAGTLIPEERGFDPNLPQYPYDPAGAKKLLAEAGYPDGIGPFELSVDTEQERGGGEVTAIADQLGKAGFKVNIKEYEPGDFDTKLLEMADNPTALGPLLFDGHSGGQTFDGSFFLSDIQSCDATRDPEFYYYCNTQAQQEISESEEIAASDPDKSTTLLQQADKLLHDDNWAVPLWQDPDLYGVRKDLNWKADSSGQTSGFFASWK